MSSDRFGQGFDLRARQEESSRDLRYGLLAPALYISWVDKIASTNNTFDVLSNDSGLLDSVLRRCVVVIGVAVAAVAMVVMMVMVMVMMMAARAAARRDVERVTDSIST